MAGTTDGQYAHDVLLSFEPLQYRGACWHYVWKAYAASGAWTGQGSTPTAYAAWNATSGKHPGDRNPPPGAAVWLGRRYYDGNMDGDVFIAGQYDGDHAATDQATNYQTGVCTLQARIDLCGREYLGWSDHVLDCPIALGGVEPPEPPKPEPIEWMDDVMDYYARGSDDTQGRIWKLDIDAAEKWQLNPSEWAAVQGAYSGAGQKTPLSMITSSQLSKFKTISHPPAKASSAAYSATSWGGLAALGVIALVAIGAAVVWIAQAAGVG